MREFTETAIVFVMNIKQKNPQVRARLHHLEQDVGYRTGFSYAG